VNVTCPSCGADMDLDVLLAHEDSRQALARLASISLPLGKRVLQYIRLFKPARRQLGHGRVVKLIEELLPDLQRGAITHNGRDWPCDLDTWSTAIDRVLERRDTGKLTLPLKSHGYLYEVLAGLSDKTEAKAERDTEADRRERRTTAAAPDLQPAVVLQPLVVPAYAGPSLYARRLKAELDARRAARLAPPDAPNEEGPAP
jgi:hypothetical protein